MDGGSVWLCRWIGGQWMADPCGCVGGYMDNGWWIYVAV